MATEPANRYGKLEKPDEITRIEIIENPLQVIQKAYLSYQRITEHIIRSYKARCLADLLDHPRFYEEAYREAQQLFEGKEQLKPDTKDIATFLWWVEQQTDKSQTNYTIGPFLSALQKTTHLEVLVVDSNLRLSRLGDELPSKKSLVVGKRMTVRHLGYASEGTILNWGKVSQLANMANNGFYSSWGPVVYCGAVRGHGGVFVNFYNNSPLTCKSQGVAPEGGIFVNLGSMSYLTGADRSVRVNFGFSNVPGNVRAPGGSGTLLDYGHPYKDRETKITLLQSIYRYLRKNKLRLLRIESNLLVNQYRIFDGYYSHGGDFFVKYDRTFCDYDKTFYRLLGALEKKVLQLRSLERFRNAQPSDAKEIIAQVPKYLALKQEVLNASDELKEYVENSVEKRYGK